MLRLQGSLTEIRKISGVAWVLLTEIRQISCGSHLASKPLCPLML